VNKPVSEKQVRISFLGDISLNNGYEDLYTEGIKPFAKVNKFLENTDYLVGNLESFIHTGKGQNTLKKSRLSTKPNSLKLLLGIKPDLVTVANNHVFDHLQDGFNRTIAFLKEHGIKSLGASTIKDAKQHIFIEKIGGFRIAFLNYVHLGTNPNFPDDIDIKVSVYNKTQIAGDIKEIRAEADYVILLFHWGLDH